MLYNIDFTVAALIILAFLFGHYLRNNAPTNRPSRIFLIFMVALVVLAAVDIVDVACLSDMSLPANARFTMCTFYMCLELCTAPLLMCFLPIVVMDVAKPEMRWLKNLLIPAYMCIAAIVFINPATGFFFTIDSLSGRYIPGIGAPVLTVYNFLYITAAIVIVMHGRKRIDSYRLFSIWLVVAIGFFCIFAQAVLWQYRTTVFCYTIIVLEMYLSYQIPERRMDTLTGLYNRQTFTESTKRMMAQNPDSTFVMVSTNIIEFKAINELHGYEVGDKILAGIASWLQSYLEGNGPAARLQSDHFAFCIPQEHFDLEELLARTDGATFLRKYGCDLTMVFGIFTTDDARIEPSVMCDKARLAMSEIELYRNKRYAFYDLKHGEQFLKGHEISSEMNTALETNQFKVYLQPIFTLEDPTPVAAEALVRWKHPEKGMLSPGDFIPVFERTGQITELDEFVRHTICNKLEQWGKQNLELLPISMNISRADLQMHLNDSISNLFVDYNVEPKYIRFEITETAYIEQINPLTHFIEHLHNNGCGAYLDDFGSGYSSLSVLENAPFDLMKVDRAFLADVMTDERSRTVLASTIRLAHKLDLPVVIEGVETKEQADLVRSMGAKFAQGYYFARPMSIDEFEGTVLSPAVEADF